MLSVACGLPNVGVHYETWNTGVGGPVVLHRLDEGSRDLTWQTWSYQWLPSLVEVCTGLPGISFRTDNEPFKMAMQGFTQKIVGMMKSENLFASQGVPIILSQASIIFSLGLIENEYGPEGREFRPAGQAYINKAAKMAVGLGTGVPWVMWKEEDAPDPVINACNGFYCDAFSPNKPYKPTMWTEAWSGYKCALTNVHNILGSRNLLGPSANGRLKILHLLDLYKRVVLLSITTCTMEEQILGALLGVPSSQQAMIMMLQLMNMDFLENQSTVILKNSTELLSYASRLWFLLTQQLLPLYHARGMLAHVFQSPSGCAAFLANYNSNSYANVVFNNEQYSLPHWSISILPDCKNVVFNSVTVGVQTSQMQMCGDDASSMTWKRYDEEVYSLAAAPLLTTTSLLEQLNVTRDNSDYLWYITSVDISSSENFLQGGGKPLSLSVQSAGHALHVFVNGQLQGSAYGTRED
ncbi:Beta-galactosidase 5 [Zea mays]|uniref:beta-galactosidase n=1 Tax=Zea mays TaxID=4577 RepID=A0A1D6PQ23_MAIZE|nr:Beta-galactosidase 5 [Zea mays]AQK48889.1 Beta-galactosidase 5 [Zea mays]